MSNKIKTNDDEIEFFRLLQLLLEGKWIIIVFLLVSIFFGLFFISNTKKDYESKLNINIFYIPPFADKHELLSNFEQLFFSKTIFENWKKNNKPSLPDYKTLSTYKIIEGYLISKSKNELFVKFNKKKKQIVIKSNDLQLLNDYFNYARYINMTIKSQYVKKTKKLLDHVNSINQRDYMHKSSFVDKQIKIYDFLVKMNEEAVILKIKRPTMPILTTPNTIQVLVISIIVGFFLGVFNVFAYNIFKKYNKK